MPQRGRHDALECDPNEAATRAFRFRRLAEGRTANGHIERSSRALLIWPQGRNGAHRWQGREPASPKTDYPRMVEALSFEAVTSVKRGTFLEFQLYMVR